MPRNDVLKRKNRAWRLRLVFAVLCWSAAWISGVAQPDVTGSRLETPHFTIISPDAEARNAAFYGELMEASLERVAPDWGENRRPDERIPVRVSPTRQDFEAATGMGAHSALAVAFPERQAIVLNGQALQSVDPLQRVQTLDHEMVHLLLGRIAGGQARVPYWLHEGLAKILSGERGDPSDVRLAWAALRGKLLPMTDLIDAFPYGEATAPLAYEQSVSFTHYAATEFLGFQTVHGFFAYLSADPDRAQTLLSRLFDERVVRDIEFGWHQNSRGVKNWLIVLTSSSILWPLLALFAFLTWLAKKRRARAVMQDWDAWERTTEFDEEEDERDADPGRWADGGTRIP